MEQIQILNNGDPLYDIRRKINENFRLTHEKIGNISSEAVRFTVNSGNETLGVADLLIREGSTLTFKVGGQYPNLVVTSGKGNTQEITSLNPLYMAGLSTGTYVIVVDGPNTQVVGNNKFHYQLLEPTEVEEGDIWFNGEGAYQYITTEENTGWIDYNFVPIGEVLFRTNAIASSTTYPYNRNALVVATTSTFGMLRMAADSDEIDCSCNDAVLTPSNLYDINNYRRVNAEYNVDDKVGCPYHHNLQLKCTQAGTTSNEALNTKGYLEPGTTIEDGTVIWEVQELGTGGGGMPIGTIFSHTCSASFIPENSLPCDGSEYTQGQLPNVYNDWLVGGKLKTCTYTEYSNMLATYGQCPMWGLDTANKKFKVPTIKDGAVIQQAMSGSEIGKAYNAGLPNIEGSMKLFGDQGVGSNVETTPSGALYSGDLIGTGVTMRATNHQGYRLSFDASRSNSIYGGSNTVQSNAVALRYFVIVATKSINASVMDWSNLANSLTSKLNTDVSNITAQGRSSIAGFAAPSNKYIDFTIGAAWSTYTAPANGYIMVDYSVTSQGGWSFIWNTTSKLGVGGLGSYWTGIQNRWTLPVKKDDVVEISYDGVTMRTIRFVYAQGES